MDDLISRQAAIDALENDKAELDKIIKGMSAEDMLLKYYVAQHNQVSCDIDAIVQLPPIQPVNNSEVPNSSDTISRQSAIDAVMECYDNDELFEVYEWKLNELPHIQPIQPKRGRWIKLDMHRGMADHKCTVCKQECYVPTCMGEPMYAFCPNCGADMRGEQDESN